jgi:hypothetical protein
VVLDGPSSSPNSVAGTAARRCAWTCAGCAAASGRRARHRTGRPACKDRPQVDPTASPAGLLIVNAVADEVGVEQVPGGKHVYASFDT